MKSILDPSFRYTKSIETDIRKTFARVRREAREQAKEPPVVLRLFRTQQARKGTK